VHLRETLYLKPYMNHLVKNEYGFCQDGKVYINAYLNFPQREIGFVRNTEQEALDYFVNRFELAKTKVIQLASEINDVQNKGSYLTKVVQMMVLVILCRSLSSWIHWKCSCAI
jgi:hypothetical protein